MIQLLHYWTMRESPREKHFLHMDKARFTSVNLLLICLLRKFKSSHSMYLHKIMKPLVEVSWLTLSGSKYFFKNASKKDHWENSQVIEISTKQIKTTCPFMPSFNFSIANIFFPTPEVKLLSCYYLHTCPTLKLFYLVFLFSDSKFLENNDSIFLVIISSSPLLQYLVTKVFANNLFYLNS